MRTTITLDDRLLRAAKRHAAEHGTTLSAVVADALRAKLARPTGTAARPFKLVTFRGGGPTKGVDLDRTSTLLEEEDVEQYARRSNREAR